MQNILLFDKTKKNVESGLFLAHLSEIINKIERFIILHLI